MHVRNIAPAIKDVTIEPKLIGMLGTVALDQRACLFKLHPASACLFYFLPTSCPGIIATGSADIFTIRHVRCRCTQPPGTSVTIKLDQHACLIELHLPTDMFESVATDLQAHL